MGYSGLIYAAIVAAWLAVLVPRWVRRNEEVERARETDAASGVRVLTRRTGPIHASHPGADDGSEERTIVSGNPSGLVLPRPGRSVDSADDGARAAPSSAGERLANDSAGEPAGRAPHGWESAADRLDAAFASAAARRRRMLIVLLLVTVAVVVGAYLGRLPAWAPTVSGSMLVGFLLSARRAAVEQARRRAVLRRRMSVQARETAVEPEPVEEPVLTEDGKRVAVLDIPEVLEAPAEDTWEPVDVPLPTYMTKAKAPRVARKIDLSVPGSWTSGRLEPTRSFDLPSHPPAASAEGVQMADDSAASSEPEELQEDRRAVGE